MCQLPQKAQADYKDTLTDSRLGVNLTSSEAKEMALIIAPLLKQGLSPYQILQIHPEIDISERPYLQRLLKLQPLAFVTQMDTVYNDETKGPFIQTFKLVQAGILCCRQN